MDGRTDRSKRTSQNRIVIFLMAMLMLATMPMNVFASSADSLQAIADKAGCAYEDILSSKLVAPGESVSDWIAIATGCSGNPVKRNAYLKGLEEYVTAEY